VLKIVCKTASTTTTDDPSYLSVHRRQELQLRIGSINALGVFEYEI